MRNLKKLFAVIMAVAMLATVMVPALAADGFKNEDEAKKLYDLGLFKGNSETSYVPDLGTTLNRQAGLALTIRLMGKEAAVAAMTQEEIATQLAKIVDADEITDWAKPYAAYAVKNGLTNGIDPNILPKVKFGAQLDLTGKEFINFVLKAMGYQVAWDDVLNKAADVGMLTAGQAVTIGSTVVMNRDAAVGVMASALKGTTAAGITLAQALVDSGAVSAEAMAAAGYFAPTATPTPTPVALAIDSITSNYSLRQIKVVFSTPVDKDTIKISSTAADSDTVKLLKNGTKIDLIKNLADDNQTLTLTFLGYASSQDDSLKLVVNGVATADGVKLEDSETTVVVSDLARPVLESVALTSAKTIDLVFSEPINLQDNLSQVWDQVKAGDAKLAGTLSRDADNPNKWTMTLNNKLAVGDHVLKIADLADFAGLKITAFEQTFTVVEDNTAPSVVEVEVLAVDTIKVTFSEPVDRNSGWIKVKGVQYNLSAATKKSSTVYEFTLTTPLDAASTYGETLKYKDIKDMEGNAAAETSFTFYAPADTSKPTVTVTVKDDNKLEMVWSELVDKNMVENLSNYELLDKDGKKINNFAAGVVQDGNDKKKYTMTVTTPDFSDTDIKNYTLKIKNIKDKSVIASTMDDFEFAFSTKDTKAPTVVAGPTLVDTNKVKIVFSEAMDAATLQNLSNYIFVDGSDSNKESYLSSISGATVTVGDDNKSVTLFIKDKSVEATNDGIRLLGLKDANGKQIPPSLFNAKVGILALGTFTAADIDSIQATGLNTVKIKLKNGKTFPTILSPNGFKLSDKNADTASTVAYVAGVEVKSDGSEATLTLSTNLNYDATITVGGVVYGTAIYVPAGQTTIKDSMGSALVLGSANGAIADKINPIVDKIDSPAAAELDIIFKEVVKANSDAAVLADVIVRDKDNKIVDISSKITYYNGETVTTSAGFNKIKITGLNTNEDYSVEVVGRNITDIAGNVLTSFAKATKTVK